MLPPFGELGGTPQRVETLLALAASQLLVQLTFLPVTLATPSVGDYFGVDVDDAAWTVIIRLLMLGSTVFLTSRLGEKFGHVRIFFLGIVVLTVSNLLATTSQSLLQLIIWCGLGGFGGALIIANSNAIIALVYQPNERGRAFAVPVTASRFGTLIGLLLFGLFPRIHQLAAGLYVSPGGGRSCHLVRPARPQVPGLPVGPVRR